MSTGPINELVGMSRDPVADDEEYEDWIKCEDALQFLAADTGREELILYATLPHVFVNSIAMPNETLKQSTQEDLLKWNFTAYGGWGVALWFSPERAEISAPLSSEAEPYSAAEKLVFARSFSGRSNGKHYHEILQKFIQLADLHYLDERRAYCRFDRHGDLEDVIRVVEIYSAGSESTGTIITCNRHTLDTYLALTSATVLRTFDFTRASVSRFSGWGRVATEEHVRGNVIYRQAHMPGYAGYIRGYQLVRSMISKDETFSTFSPSGAEQEYASFLTLDWRHSRIHEISCRPGETANYFNSSDLPDCAFELSPAFFRPEVLAKYKADSEKYSLDERTITCRDAWHLQSYDINEAGQVHTYLVYLRNLPIEEQMYWKSFNERPKGTISRRAYLSDFQGSWEIPYDALFHIKQWARDAESRSLTWWCLRSDHLIERVRYPVTSSPDEWANEILHLDQLIVEGFDKASLQKTAQALGRTFNPSLGSLKILRECLLGLALPGEEVAAVVSQFESLHYLRTKTKGHASSARSLSEIKRQVLANHGSFTNHFKSLCVGCAKSLDVITAAL